MINRKPIRLFVIIVFTCCTAFWAVVWCLSFKVPRQAFPDILIWIVANLCNLGLVLLVIPFIGFLVVDAVEAQRRRNLNLVLPYLPALICVAICPRMFDPWNWVTTFVGAS